LNKYATGDVLCNIRMSSDSVHNMAPKKKSKKKKSM